MSRTAESKTRLRHFVFQFVVLLVAAYFVWYAYAPVFVWPIALVTDLLASLSMDGVFYAVRQKGEVIEVLTIPQAPVIEVYAADGKAVRQGHALPISVLTIAYGTPFFIALSLASPAGWKRQLVVLLLGCAILTLGQGLSLLAKAAWELRSLLVPEQGMGPCTAHCLRHGLYYLHYLSFLVLPPLLPVILWAMFHARFAKTVMPLYAMLADKPS